MGTNGSHISARTDVWSAAVIAFILLAGRPPVEVATPKCPYFRKIKEGDWEGFWTAHYNYQQNISPEAKAFLQHLLSAAWRPAVDVILKHPWLSSTSDPPLSELSAFIAGKMRGANEGDSNSGVQVIRGGHEVACVV